MNMNEEIETVIPQLLDKPWRNEMGKTKDDNEIREMATRWTASTWEAYLKDIEMGEDVESSPDDEVLFAHASREDIFSTENYLINFISNLKIQYFPKLQKALKRAISTLSKQQHEIIVLHFWEGLTQTQIALKLEVSPVSIFRQLERALIKIQTEILNELGGKKKCHPDSTEKSACLKSKSTNQANSTP